MRPDDNLIIRHLDDEWRTAPAVHRLLGERGAVADIAYALERLARGLHLLQDPERGTSLSRSCTKLISVAFQR